jgi:hypothetical protein
VDGSPGTVGTEVVVVLALVVHESFFGCTREVAAAVAAGLGDRPGVVVRVVHVREAPPTLTGTDLLVVGAPTHLGTLSSGTSRWLQAQFWGAPSGRRRRRRPYGRPLTADALRSWLRDVEVPATPPRAAVFDTRTRGRLVGGAGPPAARRLSARGLTLVGTPAAFTVEGVTGPVSPGDLARARSWGTHLATTLHASPPPHAGRDR